VRSCGRTERPRSGTREGVALREGASERLLRSAAKYLGPRAADLGPLTSGLVGWSRPSTAASHGASTHQRPPARTKSARYHDPRASHPSREAAYSASRQLLVAFAAFTRSLARSLARLAEMAASTETLDKVLADQALPSQPSLDDTLRSWIAVPADDTSYRTGLKVSTNLHEPPRPHTRHTPRTTINRSRSISSLDRYQLHHYNLKIQRDYSPSLSLSLSLSRYERYLSISLARSQVWNSLSRTKSEFIPRNGRHVSWYICGPTVYDHSHIGHGSS